MANAMYSIGAIFELIDRFSGPLKQINTQSSIVETTMSRSTAVFNTGIAKAGAAIKGFGKIAAGTAIASITAGVGVATKQFIDFEENLHRSAAAFSDINSQSADFADRMAEIGQAARDVAAATEFNALEASNALTVLAQAGVESSNAVALLPQIATLATAANIDLAEATSMAVQSLNVMGMASDDPLVMAQNMQRMADVMAYTADSAKMSMSDVGAAIAAGGALFKDGNQDLNQFSAALTALAKNGIAGAEAGTALRNIMARISAPTGEAAQSLKALGIQTTDSEGNLLAFTDIIGQFEKSMAGLGDAERNFHIKKIFGVQEIAPFNALLAEGADSLNKYTAAAAKSTGAVTEKAEVIRSSIGNQIKVLMSALTELGFKFVEAFQTQGGNAIQSLTNFINSLDVSAIVAGVASLADFLAKVFSFLWNIKGVIVAIIATFAVIKTAMFAVGAFHTAMEVWQGIQIAFAIAANGSAAATSALAFASGTATTACTAFGVALTIITSPITWIIVAVGLLVAGFIALWKHIDGAREGFNNFLNLPVVQFLQEWIAPFNAIMLMVKGLLDGIANIKAAFANGGVAAGLKAIGGMLLNMVLAPVQALLEMLSKIPGLGKLADFGANKLEELRANLVSTAPTQAIQPAAQAKATYGSPANARQISDYAAMMQANSARAAQAATPVQAPVTQGERAAYTRTETNNNSYLQIGVEKGVNITKQSFAPGVNIQTATSGAF